MVYFGLDRISKITLNPGNIYPKITEASLYNSLVSGLNNSKEGDSFLSQSKTAFLESPELKIIQGDSLAAVCPPRTLSLKVLGALFGQGPQIRKEIIEYSVEQGDTLKSIAQKFDISLDTLLWANELSKSSKIKIGEELVIPPVSGVIHIVKKGDTLSEIAKTYKAKSDEIADFNELSDESDIYIGDILIVPDGVMPKIVPSFPETYLAENYFIFPTEGKITQGLHWYNAVDIGNKCGTPIFAAAAGQVLKAKYGWNGGGGNIVTILHKDGVVSYYGHLMTIFVNPGDKVDVGERIGLMGGQPGISGSGKSTGCHLHFTVIGAKNPFRNLYVGYQMKYVGE